MQRRTSPSRMLGSIVRPALGLSLSVLAAASASIGCGNTASPGSSTTGVSPEGTSKIPPPGAVPPVLATAAQPTATQPVATAAQPTTTATTPPAPTAVATITEKPIPTTTGTERPHPPGLRPVPPGMNPSPPPVPRPGTVAQPGLAPSGAPRVASDIRPTRPTRRATDPDRVALRRGLSGRRALS
ncbi:MAG: hypothetical protein U0359_15110 [Byssovorax sp.]